MFFDHLGLFSIPKNLYLDKTSPAHFIFLQYNIELVLRNGIDEDHFVDNETWMKVTCAIVRRSYIFDKLILIL